MLRQNPPYCHEISSQCLWDTSWYVLKYIAKQSTSLWRACNLTSFSPCLTGPVDYLFASRHKEPRFKTPGGLVWNRDSPVSVVSLHWWPRCDWSLWLRLMRASSQTVSRPLCRQCDNPTWYHTAFLSRIHARCRSPFRVHNWRSWLLGGSTVESLQSYFILTMSHWSSWLPVCFLSQGTRAQIPRGVTCVKPEFSC